MMGISLIGWGLAPSVFALLIVLIPTSFSGGILNTLLSSTLTKAVAPHEIGGILGLSTAVESSTRIIAPIIGGVLLERFGTSAPGYFGGAVMAGLLVFVWLAIYDHPIVHTLKKDAKPVVQPAAD
jgi:DHA1 family tetracycline resistance protein-like MFS transporter